MRKPDSSSSPLPKRRARKILGLCGVVGMMSVALPLSAEDVLFIGNSFTYGGNVRAIKGHGGVPKLVEAIAASKEKSLSSRMVATGGKDWGFHLAQPETSEALKEKPWNWVVLQDYSTKPTRLGNLEDFLNNGETFYRRIREVSPETGILLYQTWAREKGHKFYTEPQQGFREPSEMTAELVAGYAQLQRRLAQMDPAHEIRLAPVGLAFALCSEKYPDIPLFAADKYHASAQGSYLAALVLYAALFEDSPMGATWEFPGITFDKEQALCLQRIAEEACARTAGQKQSAL